MNLRNVRRTGLLVGIAFLLSAVIVAGVIGLVAVLRTDTGRPGPAAAAEPTSSASPTAPPTTPPAASPTTSATASPTTTPGLSSSPVAKSVPPAAKTTTPVTPKAQGPITYVVKRGDNLTVIAAWFKQHGYGKLYERNRRVIGDNPNLIRPGQRITVSSTGMSTAR